jgi:EAL domain-containing protein (putative c-di-GMP-specific phosphodiesterase class I)
MRVMLGKVRPDMIKVDARELNDLAATRELLSRAAVQGVQIVFKRVENAQVFDQLAALVEELALPLYAQGYLWDTPAALLRTNAADVKVA